MFFWLFIISDEEEGKGAAAAAAAAAAAIAVASTQKEEKSPTLGIEGGGRFCRALSFAYSLPWASRAATWRGRETTEKSRRDDITRPDLFPLSRVSGGKREEKGEGGGQER